MAERSGEGGEQIETVFVVGKGAGERGRREQLGGNKRRKDAASKSGKEAPPVFVTAVNMKWMPLHSCVQFNSLFSFGRKGLELKAVDPA